MAAAVTIGSIEPYDENVEAWDSYIERFEQFVAANDISNEKIVAVFLTVIGSKTYGLLRTLVVPEKPSSKTYAQLSDRLSKHLSPKPLIIAERFRFYKRNQRDGESISQYVTEIKKLSQNCKFGDTLGDALRDRLVCGLTNENLQIQRRLLSESALTFTRAFELAISLERASHDSMELTKGCDMSTVSVHKVVGKPFRKHDNRQQSKSECIRCACTGHTPDKCRFKEATCHACGKKWHIKTACLSRKKPIDKRSKSVHAVGQEVDHSDESDDSLDDAIHTLELYSLGRNSDAIWVSVGIEDQTIRMELDTGSAVSVISKQDYHKYFSNIPLQKCQIRLETYTKEKIVPHGMISVHVKCNGQQKTLNLYVFSKGGPPLFGREWLNALKLDWPEIKKLNFSETIAVSAKLEAILQQHAAVFSPGFGKVKGQEAVLTVEPGSQPRFYKARPVPYALCPKVEQELDRLQWEGIISPVKHSKWAAPVVPVIKRNGSIRICGGFKTTVNPVLEVEQYPLPRIEDIFASLSPGENFLR